MFLGSGPLDAASEQNPKTEAATEVAAEEVAAEEVATAPPRTIRIIKLDWDSARLTQAILAEVLRRYLGFEIEWVAEGGLSLHGLAQNNAADFISEVWLPERTNSWSRYIGPDSDRSLHVNQEPYLANDGLYVGQRIARDYDFKKIEDLKRPEIVRLLDSDGDGRGEIWIGEEGWNSTYVHQVKARSYGYAPFYELLVDSEEAQGARLKDAFGAGRPIVFYGWEPSEVLNSYNVLRLEEPPFTGFRGEEWKEDPQYNPDGCFYLASSEKPGWLEKSEIDCATPTSKIWLIHRGDLHERHPESARFLHQTIITAYMVRSWLRLSIDYQMEPEELAQLWVQNNPEIVAEWLAKGESAIILQQ